MAETCVFFLQSNTSYLKNWVWLFAVQQTNSKETSVKITLSQQKKKSRYYRHFILEILFNVSKASRWIVTAPSCRSDTQKRNEEEKQNKQSESLITVVWTQKPGIEQFGNY